MAIRSATCEDIVEVVGDHHHGQTAVAEAAHQVEHHPGLHHAERRGGLVEEDHLGVPHHRLGDRDRLALATRERRHRLADGAHRGHPQAAQGLRRRPLHGILVEQTAPEPLPAQEHVLDDVEVVGQGEVLVHGLDAETGRVPGVADVDRPTLEEDLPVVGLVHAGDAAGQHRLAGAVVPAEAGDLAGGQIQVHLVERLDRAEVLVDAPQLQERLHRSRRPARRSAGVVIHLSRLRHGTRSRYGRPGATRRQPARR